MKEIREEFNQEGINQVANFQAAIPGESLTNSPEQSYPWESPPRFTKLEEALDFITSEILVEERFLRIMDAVSQGVPLSDITTMILKQGFADGAFSPDLMLLLAEPIMYVLMALAEKSGIEFILYEGENEEEEEDEEELEGEGMQDIVRANIDRESLEQVQLPESVEEQIEEAEVPNSLLARSE